MPATAPTMMSSQAAIERLGQLFADAANFVPVDRGETLVKKWVARQSSAAASAERLLAMLSDAAELTMDLLVCQPSFTGTTAFDRLARNLGRVSPEDAAALGALRASRFRLLDPLPGELRGDIVVRDILSGETLKIEAPDLPRSAMEVPLFARFAPLDGNGSGCLLGSITPLDDQALYIARGHKGAGSPDPAANARWAETVFAHVVQHGTLEIPGLNRPLYDDDDFTGLTDIDPTMIDLAVAWVALGGAAPDAELLQQTREAVNLPRILDALEGAVLLRQTDQHDMQAALESILAIQLETVSRRERSGATGLTLDVLARALDEAIATRDWPPQARELFHRLRPRAGAQSDAGTRPSGDPALDRLVQRIQGLRAKTVAQGCTEQEAMAAAEKVAELLDRYGLTLSELELQAQPCEGIGIQTDRRRLAPIDQCVPAIAGFFDCRVWAEKAENGRFRYIFFGLRGDVTAAQYLYELVERAFDTETALFRKSDLYLAMAGDRRRATNSFQIGLSSGITTRLEALRAARDATIRSASGRDLVPVKAAMVDDELAKLGLNLTRREMGRGRSVLSDAYAAGHQAGERFEFTQGITDHS